MTTAIILKNQKLVDTNILTPNTIAMPTTTAPKSNTNTPQKQNTNTEKRKTKQKYVYQLWLHLYKRIQPIVTKPGLTFEELTKLLGNEIVMKLMSSFYTVLVSFVHQTAITKESLQLTNTNANAKNGQNKNKNRNKNSQEIKNARIILSSLMVCKFPTDVLDTPDVQDLEPLAEDCYTNAQSVVNHILTHKPKFESEDENENGNANANGDISRLQCANILRMIDQFMESFVSWQMEDKEKLLGSVLNIYEQWTRSLKVLVRSSMNELQKKSILNTLKRNQQLSQSRIRKIVGEQQARELCARIDAKVAAEPDFIAPAKTPHNSTQNSSERTSAATPTTTAAPTATATMMPNHNNGNGSNGDIALGVVDEEEKEEMERQRIAQVLASKGVPMNIKSGFNFSQNNNNNNNSTDNNNNNSNASAAVVGDEQYIEEIDGRQVLNLDKIVIQEASKQYWTDFGVEIANQKFERLFELISELLERIKKISPSKHQSSLDDLLDVQFIQQTIERGLIDGPAFYGIFVAIWEQIKSLHAPAEDAAWNQWREDILHQMQSNQATWNELLPRIFNRFFIKLDRIEDIVEQVKQIKLNNKPTTKSSSKQEEE